jgi:hypothetical protein
MFERFSKEAGKKQYLIPYFIAAHPGTTDVDMLNLALWLKKNNFKLDQVQTFTPTPMAMATTMYHTRKNPLHKVDANSEIVETARSGKIRRVHKAFLRYYDPENWPILREALGQMGRGDLIGYGEKHLIPPAQPKEGGAVPAGVERKRGPAAGPAPVRERGEREASASRPRKAERVKVSAERVPAGAAKARPSILSTIKAKPKAGRK